MNDSPGSRNRQRLARHFGTLAAFPTGLIELFGRNVIKGAFLTGKLGSKAGDKRGMARRSLTKKR
jgi:hypothetical protein